MNPRGDVLIDTEREETTAPEVCHGAHVSCQVDRPAVTAICGVQLSWIDETPEDRWNRDACVVCLDLLTCPVCGIRVHA